MSKTIVITGATGFIGQQLGIELVSRGYRIICLTRSPQRWKGLTAFPCEFIGWDDQYNFDSQILEGAEALIHLAGASVAKRRTSQYRKEILSSRVQSSLAIVNAINRCHTPPKVVIHTSGIGYYGDTQDKICTEDQEMGNDFLAQVCKSWEEPFIKIQNSSRDVCLRIGMVLGWQGGSLPLLHQVYISQLGAELGSGRQWLSWIHIDDLVRLFIAVLENPTFNGTYNAVAPEPTQFSQFNQLLGIYTSSWSRKSIPSPLLRLGIGDQANMVLNSQNVSSEKLRKQGFLFSYENIRKAFDALYMKWNISSNHLHLCQQWVEAPLNETRMPKILPPMRGMAFWDHQMEFRPLNQGMLITEIVRYKFYFSFLLNSLLGHVIHSKLEKIFKQRTNKLKQAFSQYPPSNYYDQNLSP